MKLQIKLQPVLASLTIANFALLVFLLSQARAVAAPAPDDGIIRGKGLQIVDASGAVRASISAISSQAMASSIASFEG